MKDFVTPEIAEELNKLGFNEPCLASWNYYTNQINYNQGPSNFHSEDVIQLPTYSHTFRWFRENHGLFVAPSVISYEGGPYLWFFEINSTTLPFGTDLGVTDDFKTYEEAELACLDKLIEIKKNDK